MHSGASAACVCVCVSVYKFLAHIMYLCLMFYVREVRIMLCLLLRLIFLSPTLRESMSSYTTSLDSVLKRAYRCVMLCVAALNAITPNVFVRYQLNMGLE